MSEITTDSVINAKTYMDISAKDIETGKNYAVAKIDVNNEKQFLRQFWDTDVSTENFWWLDSTHVMQLTNSKIIIHSKKSDSSTEDGYAVDDWNGNKWDSVEYDRAKYIDSSVSRYGVTSVFGSGTTALFWTLSSETDSNKINVSFYLPLSSMKKYTSSLSVNVVPLGEDLVSDYTEPVLNSYKPITAYALLSTAKISSTHIGHAVLMGFSIDKALCQWTCGFSDEDYICKHVITGYGFVGPDGSLTGGQIPSVAFDSRKGFATAVQEIKALPEGGGETTSIDGSFTIQGVYGNASQQWYVYKDIEKICSHYKFKLANDVSGDGGLSALYPVYLPIENHYSANYASTSFYVNKITGFLPSVTTLGAMFPFDNASFKTALTILTAIASPAIWYLTPSWTKFGFLEQSIGQFTYVYNTTSEQLVDNRKLDENKDNSSTNTTPLQISNGASLLDTFKDEGKVLTKDSLSFDKQERSQTILSDTTRANKVGGFWLALFMSGVLSGDNFGKSVQINSTQNQTSTSDIAKQFSQFAVENALTAATTDIGASASTNIALASKVVAVKTLDMFYSTSANSHMYAGPGYVCHNFVAQCVAQSVSNRFIQANQNGMFTLLIPLSKISMMIHTLALKAAAKLADKIAAATGTSSVAGTSAGSVLAAIALYVVNAVIQTAIDTNEFFMNILPDIAACLTSNYPSASFYKSGNISNHTIDIEAKHKYGNKHCTFMWPCFGASGTYMTLEKPKAVIESTKTEVNFGKETELWESLSVESSKGVVNLVDSDQIPHVTSTANDTFKDKLTGDLVSEYIYCYGLPSDKSKNGKMVYPDFPSDMSVIEGTDSFLPKKSFKNENIDVPLNFTPAPIQDYMLSEDWELSETANDTGVLWVGCKDTKLIDGAPSNIIITDSECLVACPYCALELNNQIEEEYVRPSVSTPTSLSFNQTGLNVVYEKKIYHGFDGVGYRTVQWQGSSGLDQEHLAFAYAFQINDHFKRSNILPANQFMGNFNSLPSVCINSYDKVYQDYRIDNLKIGSINTVSEENREQIRLSLPVFTELISTLPTFIKTLTSYKVDVFEGVTGLTSESRVTQGNYKVPKSTDFTINESVYRSTNEYINLLNDQGLSVKELVAKLGMQFVGSTPQQAFFYSANTRAYYVYTGGTVITKADVWNRFKDIKDGKWDFVNQEVVFQCLGNMTRLYDDTSDSDDEELDNLFIARLSGDGVKGEVNPPSKAIFDSTKESSWFKIYSMASGLVFQGPNRGIVNRFICLDYMLEDIISNRGKWKKVSRDVFNPFRKYKEDFKNVATRITEGVEGWTHNPFLLCTAPLGIDEQTDCLFEWELTFTWTDEMDTLYKDGSYACVNMMGQTMCPGGKKRSEVTHLYLTKELFTRGENSGYYSFRFSSRNGAGNREQLFIWSDSYIAMTGLKLSYKIITSKRQQAPATSQIDIQKLKEF